jgi:UDP-glucose 4-epimerase
VLGRRYTVPFRGATLFQYAEDVAKTLIQASRSGLEGSSVFNLAGSLADDGDLVRSIASLVPEATDLISFEPVELPFPSQIDTAGLEAIGPVPTTSFEDGVRASIEIYRSLLREGRLVAAEHGLDA